MVKKYFFDINNIVIIADQILQGEICVIPTDTLYGLSANAFIPEAVEKIYVLKERSDNKPFIILISSLEDLKHFDIHLTDKNKMFLEQNWPNPLSVVLECPNPKLNYLHRGTNTLAFRVPKFPLLLELLKVAGPLTSTTVNKSTEQPVTNIEQAITLFNDQVVYIDYQQDLDAPPSTVIKLTNDRYELLRSGTYKIG